MNAKRCLSILTVLVVLLATMLYGMGNTMADAGDDGWDVDVEEGKNYKLFRFGKADGYSDAAFGVRWGSAEDEGALNTFSVQSRYVAMTSVSDEKGESIYEDRPIKVQSLLAARLWRIFEYNDSNENGLCDHLLDEDGEFMEFEEIYKYIDLRDANWSVGDLIEEQAGDNTTWEFTLTAKDLRYYDASALPQKVLYPGGENHELEYVNFTFHLMAGTKTIEDASMPRFRVTVHRGVGPMQRLHEVEKEPDHKFTGVVGSYDIKWDHEIVGWDIESDNTNPALFMEFHNIVGNHMPPEMPRWQHRFIYQTGENVRARYNDNEGEHFSNLTEEPPLRERRLNRNRVEYAGERSKVGRFRWVSDVVVDGEDMEMQAQLIRGRPVVHTGPFSRNFVGFAVYGGFNYPGGNHIFHDPGIDGSAYLDISGEMETTGILSGRSLTVALMVGAAIVIVAALLYGGSDKKKVRNSLYDTDKTEKKNDWSDYYDRD